MLTAEKLKAMARDLNKDAKPQGWRDYSVSFKVERIGRLFPRWEVASYDFYHVRRHEFGPVFSRKLAQRVEILLTQHYRNGWDMGYRREARYGGGRIA